jgi:ketosteroid isomerase-like protein
LAINKYVRIKRDIVEQVGLGMDSSKLMSVALEFNRKINERDLNGLADLMSDDHVFVDGEGNVTKGKKVMKEGWRDFFEKYPDYRNRFTCVTVQDNMVVMVGYSECSSKPLAGPSVWTAKVRGERVSEWRVFWLSER